MLPQKLCSLEVVEIPGNSLLVDSAEFLLRLVLKPAKIRFHTLSSHPTNNNHLVDDEQVI